MEFLRLSTLGPVLFTVYVNDLLSVPTYCKLACHVDDPKQYMSFPSIAVSTAIDNLNVDLESISRWCCQNSLLINPGKTKVFMIDEPQLLLQLPTISVRILGKEITPVTVAKDLGIYIVQSLTYNDHITKTVSTCLYKLIQINRIKHLLDKKTLLLLINSIVFSKLHYCSTVWSNTSKRNIKKLHQYRTLQLALYLVSRSLIMFHKVSNL